MVVPINEAREEMADSLINILDFSITIPLTDSTKHIHTNSFIKLNQDLFEADDLFNIYTQMGKTTASRYTQFRKGYWYVAETEVSYKNNTMKLKLLALPSVPNYDKKDMDASSSNSNTGKTVNKNTSSNSDFKLKNVPCLGKSDNAFLQDIVKKAIGTASTDLARAKNIYNYYNNHHVYSSYSCMQHTTFKSGWNDKGLNCGDGARVLCMMFKCIGLNPQMGNGHNHFWVRVKIDGKYYYCDQAGSPGARNTRTIGTAGSNANVWGGVGGGSYFDYCHKC